MRFRLPLLVLALSATLSAYSYLAFEQITVGATAVGFTAAKITPVGSGPPATMAICTLRTAEVSYRFDGGTPTSSVGALWEVGETKSFSSHDVLLNFLAIRTTGTSGQLDCHYASP